MGIKQQAKLICNKMAGTQLQQPKITTATPKKIIIGRAHVRHKHFGQGGPDRGPMGRREYQPCQILTSRTTTRNAEQATQHTHWESYAPCATTKDSPQHTQHTAATLIPKPVSVLDPTTVQSPVIYVSAKEQDIVNSYLLE